MADSSNQTPETFASKLDKPAQRFLAHVIEHAFQVGRRSASDFVRNFSARAVMSALDRRPDLRADILVPATGINHKVALRKSAESSGEDLQIALDEGVTSADDIVKLFRPDDRVRYLDVRKLWTFVTEGEFWKADKSKGAAFQKAKDHIAFMLDRGLADGLLNHSDLISGVSVGTLAQSLPREKLGEIIEAALSLGRDKKAFTERDLFGAAAAAVLVEDVSLLHIWETVIIPKIAQSHGFIETKIEAVAAAPSRPIKAAESRPIKLNDKPDEVTEVEPMRTKPAPGMPSARKPDFRDPSKNSKKIDGKKPVKKAKSSVVSGSLESKPVDASRPPAGLEELLVDVDDFEIEEIEEEFSDQATAT